MRIDLRIHGRGGQGAVVASKLLASALFHERKDVQSFPAFGVERRGAPVTAFLRVSDSPIRLRCEIAQPDGLIVLDPTLISAIDVTAGLKPGGTILINSASDPGDYADLASRFDVATVDASGIALRHGLGTRTQPIVNTAILGAFAASSGLVGLDSVCRAIDEEVGSRGRENIAAAREAAQAVRRGAVRSATAAVPDPPREDPKAIVAEPARAALPHGVPVTAISSTSTLVNRTGSWKYVRPMFRDLVAPCNQACPVGIDIEAYMDLLREDRIDEAVALLLGENPLPATTGRVCDHPCEQTCNRRQFDEAVSIHSVERMLGDRALLRPPAFPDPRPRGKRVGIVGSGPAGLSCAWHLARLGYQVAVFEAAREPGGMLRLGIPEYRLPRAVLDAEIDRIRSCGVTIHCGGRLGTDVPWSALDGFDAVFLGPGMQDSRSLDVPGERQPRVLQGLHFLSEVNAGGRPRLGRRVVVVGGGNTAIDCARTARRLGSEATILYRRTRKEMPAIAAEILEAEGEGVRLEFLVGPASVRVIDGRAVGLECVRMRLGEPDASGRARPVPVPESGFFVPADTILVAVGEAADRAALPEGLTPPGGALRVDPLGQVGGQLVFAGGDILEQPHTVAWAIGSGKRAAIGIDLALRARAGEAQVDGDVAPLRFGPAGNVSMARWREKGRKRVVPLVNEVIPFAALNMDHFVHVPGKRESHAPGEEACRSFQEVNQGLPRDEAMDEAKRCFNCGVCNHCEVCLVFCPDVAIRRGADGRSLAIDHEYCKGCGLCAAECPRGAIAMTREGL